MVQYPGYLRGIGVAPTLIGSVGSVMAIFSLGGNLIGGTLLDKLGVAKCMSIAGISATSSGIMLILSSNNKNFAFVFAAFLGMTVFSYIMGVAYMTGVFFGKKDYGTILGMLNLMFAVGYAVGSSLFGYIISKIGYTSTWGIVTILIMSAYIMIIIAAIGMKRLNKKKN